MKNKKASYDFPFNILIAVSIAPMPSSEPPPPNRARCWPNIKHKVDDVIHSKPNPIEQAFTAKKVIFKRWVSEPAAALSAPKVNPTNKDQFQRINLPVIIDEFVVKALNVYNQ